MEQSGSGPIRGALERLRSAPLWVWITILISLGLLVFAYLQYRKSNAASSSTGSSSSLGQGVVPTDGAGQPMWNTADQGGFVAGNVTDLAALLAYLQSQQTPNPPPTATPNPPVIGPPILGPGPGSLDNRIPQPPGAPVGSSANPTTTSGGAEYFKITQPYSSATAGTTTIAGLAHRYGTTIANLLRLNPQVNPTTQTTYVGEWIRIK